MRTTSKGDKTIAPKWLRVLMPTLLIGVWLVLAGIGGPTFGKISEVSSIDLTTFLPQSSESAVVSRQLSEFRDSKNIPVLVVFEAPNENQLKAEETEALRSAQFPLSEVAGVVDASPPVVSEDGKAAYIVLSLRSDGDFETIFKDINTELDGRNLVPWKLTGPASFARDLQEAFSGIDVTLLLVALAVVFVILLVVYRSPLLPVLVLLAAMAALAAAVFTVWYLAKQDLLQLNGQVQGILFILVIGAATDYALLYIARYREELTRHPTAWHATQAALKGSIEPIIAAGATVTVGLMLLLFSDLGSNRALGPAGGIGIAFAVAASLTFLPALLLPFGRAAFWPRQPKFESLTADENLYKKRHPVWAKVGAFVGRYPRRIWVMTTAILLIACLGLMQLNANGIAQSELILGYSEAKEGQQILDRHFPSGSGTPTYVLVNANKIDEVVTVLDADPGVASVAITASNTASGIMPVGEYRAEIEAKILAEVTKARDAQVSEVREQLETQMPSLPAEIIEAAFAAAVSNIPPAQSIAEDAYPFKDARKKIVNEQALMQVTLSDAADSDAAKETIVRLRSNLTIVDQTALVGGVTAVQYDTNQASIRDRLVLIPLILVAITLILIVLLRSIVAPLVLLLTTVVSFGATLGISALLFNHVLQFPGADPSVVLYAFVFLVALGIDYNIFLMTRVREETIKHGVREGTVKGLIVTGGVITSAGIVLASTFAALGVIPIIFLAQLAFIVAFGVLLDTLVVRSLLVPALTLDIGKPMWWPSKIARAKAKKKS